LVFVIAVLPVGPVAGIDGLVFSDRQRHGVIVVADVIVIVAGEESCGFSRVAGELTLWSLCGKSTAPTTRLTQTCKSCKRKK